MWTPCDNPVTVIDKDTGQETTKHICPYEDTYTGYEGEMCRVCCGLGVDE